ncbi:MAG: MATE family efflux transporter [Eubacteriales bacterium]|nr:MATE family efflux transporter [Eubacteriales bacterium]
MIPKNKGLLRQYLSYAFATVSSLLVYSLYSMVDGLFIARGVNEYAMSAVNLVLPYTNVLFSISVLFAVGTSTLIAIFLGQGKTEEAKRLFSQNTFVLLIIGITLTVCVLVFSGRIVRLLGADERTYDYAKEYLTGIAPFSVFFIVSYNMEVLIKTDGFPQKAFRTVTAGCICNCALDYLAIFVLDMGVFGAALATGLSQLFVCLIYFCHFLFGKSTFRFVRFKFDRHIYRRLLPLGFSDAITEICTGIMIFVFNRTVLKKLGTDGLVSYTIIAYVNTLVINTLIGASAGAQPLISFHHGRKEEDTCCRLLRYVLYAAACLETVIFVCIEFGGEAIVRVYLKGAEGAALASSAHALRIYGVSYLLLGFNVAIAGYMTAREHPFNALSITAGRGLILQCAALAVLCRFDNAELIWLAPTVSESVCLLTALILLRSAHKKHSSAI